MLCSALIELRFLDFMYLSQNGGPAVRHHKRAWAHILPNLIFLAGVYCFWIRCSVVRSVYRRRVIKRWLPHFRHNQWFVVNVDYRYWRPFD